MAMEKEQTKLRILMFPWLAHGHISPFVELSKRLSKRYNFTIYLCSTAVNLDPVRQALSDQDINLPLQLVELQMPSSPELPPELHTTRNLPPHLAAALMLAFQDSRRSFTAILDSVNPDLLMYDYFQPWAPKIASSRGIPSLLFSTSGATSFSFFHHLFTEGSADTFPHPAIRLPERETEEMLDVIVPSVKDGDDEEFAFGAAARSTEIVVLKSCRDVDGKYQDYLSFLCKKRIVCTGPLIAGNSRNEDDDVEIMKWLDNRCCDSVIYICFGSQCFLSQEQIAELAKGLQLCDADFLWVMKLASMEEEAAAVALIGEAAGRGLVAPRWAPQAKILEHPSVAGFVSHCGWSSVMESLYYGVPIIAMPKEADQPINSQLVVELGVGVEVGRDGGGLCVGVEVAAAIKKVMAEKGFRDAARGLGEAMREKEEEVLDELVEEMFKICANNKKQV